MARIAVNGYEAILGGLEDMIEKTPELRDAILNAEADVVEPFVRQGVPAANLVRTGRLRDSIGRIRVKTGGVPTIRIGPQGEHHRYLPSAGKSGVVKAGYIGYIYEYGLPKHGIRARNWLSNAVTLAKGKAYDAAEAVYDDYLKKNNL